MKPTAKLSSRQGQLLISAEKPIGRLKLYGLKKFPKASLFIPRLLFWAKPKTAAAGRMVCSIKYMCVYVCMCDGSGAGSLFHEIEIQNS